MIFRQTIGKQKQGVAGFYGIGMRARATQNPIGNSRHFKQSRRGNQRAIITRQIAYLFTRINSTDHYSCHYRRGNSMTCDISKKKVMRTAQFINKMPLPVSTCAIGRLKMGGNFEFFAIKTRRQQRLLNNRNGLQCWLLNAQMLLRNAKGNIFKHDSMETPTGKNTLTDSKGSDSQLASASRACGCSPFSFAPTGIKMGLARSAYCDAISCRGYSTATTFPSTI